MLNVLSQSNLSLNSNFVTDQTRDLKASCLKVVNHNFIPYKMG